MSICSCVNVEMGSYSRCVTVILPWSGKMAGIDICVLPEVFDLRAKGIRTIESCCGHGIADGYIAVEEGQESMMEALGYELDPKASHVFLRLHDAEVRK